MVVWITILYVWGIKYIIKNYNGYFKRKLPYEFLLESAQRMFISHRPIFALASYATAGTHGHTQTKHMKIRKNNLR